MATQNENGSYSSELLSRNFTVAIVKMGYTIGNTFNMENNSYDSLVELLRIEKPLPYLFSTQPLAVSNIVKTLSFLVKGTLSQKQPIINGTLNCSF